MTAETERTHTALPWHVEPQIRRAWIKGANGTWAALSCGDSDYEAAANAAYIVLAANLFPELVKALEEARMELAIGCAFAGRGQPDQGILPYPSLSKRMFKASEAVVAALAKARSAPPLADKDGLR